MSTNQHLTQLETSGLIRLAQALPELEYLFRHALVQEAAYRSLLRKDRQRMHRAAGEILERTYPDRLEELAPLLGHHFSVAGDDRHALEYLTLAGDVAARAYANAEAVVHYTQALEVANRIVSSGPTSPLQHLYTRRGRVLELSGRYTEALANYAEMEAAAHRREDRALELLALMARASVYSTPTTERDPEQAQTLCTQAIALARELGEYQAEAKMLWTLMVLNIYGDGDYPTAIEYGERSAAVAREFDLREQLAFTLNDLGRAYRANGDFQQAWAVLNEARDCWRELGNLPMLVDNLAGFVVQHHEAGEYEQALENLQEALHTSRSIGNLWGEANSQLWGSHVYFELGDPGQAIAGWQDAIRLGEQAGFAGPMVGARASLATAYAELGAMARGLELAHQAVAAAETHIRAWRPWALAALARLHLKAGDVTQAEAAVRESIPDTYRAGFLSHAPFLVPLAEAELALAQGDFGHTIAVMDGLCALVRSDLRTYLPTALHVKGKALLALGRVDEARAVLAEARQVAEEIGAHRRLWPILSTLSQLEDGRGNSAEAADLRQRAREIVVTIADRAGAPELRDSFLDLPDVRVVLAPMRSGASSGEQIGHGQ